MVATVPTKERAERMYEVFNDRPHKRHVKFPFSWPERLQDVGQGKAVMYRSNKWKTNLREYEDYKHLAEAWNTLLVVPGFLRVWERPSKRIDVYGPMVKLQGPMPQHFAILAPCLGFQVRLFDKGGKLPTGDARLFEVSVAHGMLGGAEHSKTKEQFLFIYTQSGGVCAIITGPKVERDGIVR